ncbi:SMI1/KNR4 family protein [Streptomyces sp. NBC_01445]|uniref:SMI1/KNR4 family protein n=1 Tax=Streptomyces sp. NBC_01445 TaxID=2903869 RepID=UPI002DDBC84E|nr:SMI1/KNR4 family protein [Streptomyces sp. NBC_01445]WSE08933.1 SMI1/KNR4 family protein [Streptomyces sp. NBC_01445]
MTDQWWAGVRQRVEGAGAGPAASKVFGALGHKWVVADPLTQGELAELEAQIGVQLPEEYRAFLLHVGAGGAGPAHGLFPVRRVQGRWGWEGDGADLADLSRLAEPFPDQGPDPELLEDVLAQRPEEEDFDDIEDFDDAIKAWDERWEAVMFAPERTAGAIVISHLGCAQREWLIINGSYRGTVWSDCRVDDVDLAPLLDDDGMPVTFARWYTDWLEKAELTALS